NPAPQLPQLLQREIASLIATARGGLSRLKLNQLASSSRQERNEQVMYLELPLQQDEGDKVVPIEIHRQAPRRGIKEPPSWRVSVALDDPRYGKVKAEVTLCGSKVSTRFRCEQQSTEALLQRGLPQLRINLQQLGFKPGTIIAVHEAVNSDEPYLHCLEGSLKENV
ncbi:MAG: flagellar hook-length control protein FliK, partial [Gammaproteobacteria bacterium]|nr:flagellar hook-length control protein FliK [Gammaproteobacteria bacterium]